MYEAACEPVDTCDEDKYAFKGLTAQWLGATAQVAPYTTDSIMPLLHSSAQAAAKQCTGGRNDTACGSSWTTSKFDGSTGLGQELFAMNVVVANLVTKSPGPEKADTSNATSTRGTGQGSKPSSSSSALQALSTGSGSSGAY